MFDYSIEFTLFSLFLAAFTIYSIKGDKINQIDILYGILLSTFYYFLLCVIDKYQTTKEGFKLLTEGYSSITPSDNDTVDETSSTDLNHAHKNIHHHYSKQNRSKQMNHDKRPDTNKHQMDDGLSNSTSSTSSTSSTHKKSNNEEPITATAGVDAPINITINLDDDVSKEYKRMPKRYYKDPQFEDGLASDRLARLERRVEQLVTRDLDNQYQEVIERSPQFSREPKIVYKEKECPVCPLVAEKPWGEWEDYENQKEDNGRLLSCLDKKERESWDNGMVQSRGGNNPLPVLP